MSGALETRNLGSRDRAAAERAWLALEQRTRSVAVACSWAWTGTWLEAFGDVVAHRFVVAHVDGTDVGIALITEAARYPSGIGVRVAHVGTAGEPRDSRVYVERNQLLVVEEHRDGFAAALLTDLARDPRWDRLELPGLVERDAEAFRLAAPRLLLTTMESPVAEFSVGGDPLADLRSGPRRRVRRALAGLAPLEVDWAQTPAQGDAVLSELIELHQRHWTGSGEPGAFASPRFTGFHRALTERLGPGRGVVLVRVRRENETVGCVYGLVEDDTVLFYQGGMRRYADNKLNAGLTVHACAMRSCAEHGLRAYDFLAPTARYKQDLSTRTETLVWAALERRRPRILVDRTLRALRARRAAAAPT